MRLRYNWLIATLTGIVVPLLFGFLLIKKSAGYTDGHFIYYMDDAYIHMGVAKNWLVNGTLGLNEKTWTSLSSSPVYTFLLIVLLKISNFSDQILWPLAMAVWVAMVVTMGAGLRRYSYLIRIFWLYQGLMFVCIPLSIAFLHGMEHLIHVWLSGLILLHWVGNWDENSNRRYLPDWLLGLLVAVCVLTRLETFLFTGGLAILDVFQGRYRRALWIGLCTAIPPLMFMAWMHAHGAAFVPNSIAVKSSLKISEPDKFFFGLFRRLVLRFNEPGRYIQLITSLSAFCLGLFGYLKLKNRLAGAFAVIGGVVLFTILTTWLDFHYRYDMWLNSLFVVAFCLATARMPLNTMAWIAMGALPLVFYIYGVHEALPGSLIIRLVILFAVVGVLAYAAYAWRAHINLTAILLIPVVPLICTLISIRFLDYLPVSYKLGKTIYLQQYSFAQFLKQYYNGERVVLNDIGTTSFYTDCPVVDRIGIATTELIPEGQKFFDADTSGGLKVLDEVARKKGAKLAVVYSRWHGVPARWILAGQWTTPDPTQHLGERVVGFYAFNRQDALLLRSRLVAFQKTLSPEVIFDKDTLAL